MYRAENLILSGMPPGPTEPTSEQLQHYLKIAVDDLIMLHEDGIIIKPPEHPNGLLFRGKSFLLNVSDKFQAYACVSLWSVSLQIIRRCASCAALPITAIIMVRARNVMFRATKCSRRSRCAIVRSHFEMHQTYLTICKAYRPRTGEEHRNLCFQYRDLSTDKERDEFFSKHGVRWTEFARLKYFDIVRFTVVDPMHNLLLGEFRDRYSRFNC